MNVNEHNQGIWSNVISVRGGVHFQQKKRYITLEWPLSAGGRRTQRGEEITNS